MTKKVKNRLIVTGVCLLLGIFVPYLLGLTLPGEEHIVLAHWGFGLLLTILVVLIGTLLLKGLSLLLEWIFEMDFDIYLDNIVDKYKKFVNGK